MANIQTAVQEIYKLEEIADQDSCIHRRHGLAKMISVLVFIIAVVSFDRYEISRLIPYVFYPVLIAALSGTPYKLLARRIALALPFVLLTGASNIIFDRSTAVVLGSMAISYGVISCIAIFYRTFLCVAAIMLLVAVTPFWDISYQLRRLHLPEIFITMFEMTYRYVGTLLEEASSMYTSYMLRSPERKGLEMKHMGSFAGQLLLRSYDRAERIYKAMKCRGFTIRNSPNRKTRFTGCDWLFLAVTCVPCIMMRAIDLPAFFTRILEGLL